MSGFQNNTVTCTVWDDSQLSQNQLYVRMTIFALLVAVVVYLGSAHDSSTVTLLCGKPHLEDYTPIPAEMELQSVVVVHRHGDRAQIARSFSPLYPEHEDLKSEWASRLPSEETRLLMKRVAITAADLKAHNPFDHSLQGPLYSGYDSKEAPYAQLTEVGAQQLVALGRRLRQRYWPHLQSALEHGGESIRLRSSNICRTLQSVRCLVAGLLDIDANHSIPLDQLPYIEATELKEHETIFPQESRCPILGKRRLDAISVLLKNQYFSTFSERLKSSFGFESVPWMNAFEVLNCHLKHGIQHIDGLSSHDIDILEKAVLHIWASMFGDEIGLKVSVGRFISDIMRDMNLYTDSKIFIYSAHDITLVPLLCALKGFDGELLPCLRDCDVHFTDCVVAYLQAVFRPMPRILRLKSLIRSTLMRKPIAWYDLFTMTRY